MAEIRIFAGLKSAKSLHVKFLFLENSGITQRTAMNLTVSRQLGGTFKERFEDLVYDERVLVV